MKRLFAFLLCMLLTLITVVSYAQESYTGTAEGFGGPVEVKLTIDDGVIIECVIAGDSETVGVGSLAIEKMPEQIVATNSAQVESISGATVTSEAIRKAAQQAINAMAGTTVETAIMTPGTYTGSAYGYADIVVVEVTVDENSILDIEIVQSQETGTVGAISMSRMCEEMLEHQTLIVDAMAGASMSANALRTSMRDALTQAGATESMFSEDCRSEAQVLSKGDIDAFEPDIIVVGAGLGGINAAMEAADLGKKVLLFEQNNYIGGTAMYSGGYCIGAGTEFQRSQGVEDHPDYLFEELMQKCSAGPNFREDLARAFADASGPAFDALIARGVDFGVLAVATTGSHEKATNIVRSAKPAGRGQAIIEALEKNLYTYTEAGSVAIRMNTQVTDLIAESGKVVGVKVGEKEYRSDAVILCCGGYESNEEIISQHFARYAACGLPRNTGNLIQPAMDVGAAVYGMGYEQVMPGTVPTGSFMTELEVYYTNPGYLWLNKHGERMINETTSSSTRTQVWNNAPDNTVYILLSQKMIDNGTTSVLNMKGYANYSQDLDNVRFYNLVEKGEVAWKAETLDELAKKAGIDVEGFMKTMNQYNEDCKIGKDTVFGREQNLIAFEEGPFYMVETIPSLKWSCGGFVIDTQARVLDNDGEPVDGLYAAGLAVGKSCIFDRVSIGGGCLGMSFIWGNVAAHTAAADIDAGSIN